MRTIYTNKDVERNKWQIQVREQGNFPLIFCA